MAITWTNVDLASVGSCAIHLMAVALEKLMKVQWNLSIKATQNGGLSKEVACHEG